MKRKVLAALLFALPLAAPPARADEPAVDEASPEAGRPVYDVDRSWLYVGDASVAAPLHAVADSHATYTSVGSSPTRPFASNVATPGAMFELGGEVGLIPHLSLAANGVAGEAGQPGATMGGTAGIRLSLLPDAWSTHAVVSGGYLRELGGDAGPLPRGAGNGVWGRVSVTQDLGRARFATTVHGEHVVLAGRDALDVMVMAGVNYRVAGPLRAGVEYVGQDLEESFDDAEEGGVRHFVGPSASAQLLGDRLTIVGGPSVGLSYASPRLLGRIGVAYSF